MLEEIQVGVLKGHVAIWVAARSCEIGLFGGFCDGLVFRLLAGRSNRLVSRLLVRGCFVSEHGPSIVDRTVLDMHAEFRVGLTKGA